MKVVTPSVIVFSQQFIRWVGLCQIDSNVYALGYHSKLRIEEFAAKKDGMGDLFNLINNQTRRTDVEIVR